MTIHYSNMDGGIYRDTNVEHAGYMKLRNIVLGYTFSKNVCRALRLNELQSSAA